MSLQSRYRFTTAWLPSGWRRNVVVSVDPAGDIVDIASDDVVTTARPINGAAIPGVPNVHSHAFQRALAGTTERRASTAQNFWSWRDAMYRLAARLTPDCMNAIAAQVYVDMLKAGYTAVCEFHYLHNQPDGAAYAEPATMCHAIIDAAMTAGIGLTLLPTLYQSSDFGAARLTEQQRRFGLKLEEFLALFTRLHAARSTPAQLEIGVGLHSLRAVSLDALQTVVQAHPDRAIHIHVAEQEREVLACREHLGAAPIEVLLEHAHIDTRWCLVHATHAQPHELEALAATGAVVGLCPTTEANLGDGYFATDEYLGRGGRLAIGSDSHITLSPCEELRWLEYQCRLRRGERNVLSSEESPSVGSLLWGAACAGGAQACARRIGAIEVGRRADIVVLDLNSPCFCGRSEDTIIDTLVFGGGDRAIRDVMVGGKWLVQEGRHFAETAIAAGYKRAIGRL